MSKILVYKMTHDSGFAPNPFGKYLTLAACTPNHMRANLQKGDWIVGLEAKHLSQQRKKAGLCEETEQLVIYVAEVSEVLNLNDYFNDLRFKYKKPIRGQGWQKKLGDNMYYTKNGAWEWIRCHMHDSKNFKFFPVSSLSNVVQKYKPLSQDIRGDRVFISENFSYFGDICLPFHSTFSDCVKQSQGIKYCHEENKNYNNFLDYLKSLMQQYGKGQQGNPILCHIDKDRYCTDKECK